MPSQSNQILGTPLKYFVTSIKLPDGETDGADKYPGESSMACYAVGTDGRYDSIFGVSVEFVGVHN